MTKSELTFENFGGGIPLDWERTKASHPYSYGPYLLYDTGEKPTASMYSDRMQQWDHSKYRRAKDKHCGTGDYFNTTNGEAVEAFLREYFSAPTLQLVRVEEHCNQATGYPLWLFAYRTN